MGGRNIAQLHKEKREKCGDSEMGGTSVKSVAARVFEGQITIFKAEGHEIGSKYGGWDELMVALDLEKAQPTDNIDVATQNGGNVSVDEVEQEVVSNEDRLKRAKELMAKCTELELNVQEAADGEDFEAAGQLQEDLDKINVEIEGLNLTEEERAVLSSTPEDVPPEPEPAEACGPTDEERLLKAQELSTTVSELERQVEVAVDAEDFEAAEGLQVTLDRATTELATLNLTEDEKEALTTESTSSGVVPSVQAESNGTKEEEDEGAEEQSSELEQEKSDNGEESTDDVVVIKDDGASKVKDASESDETGE